MSGIYLQGVEMPTGEKVLTIQICPDGSICQQYRGTVPRGKALPVPPHGRTIDADAFKKRMMQGAIDAREDALPDEIWLLVLDAAKNLCLDVDEQPTIIPGEDMT